jgi:transposase-like protein
METPSKLARRYDAEFKRNAVALVQSGRRISEGCRDLGCSTWSLGRWVSVAQNGNRLAQSKTLATETPEHREIRRLKQDHDYLRRQPPPAIATVHCPKNF